MQNLLSMNKFQILLSLALLIFFSACQKDPNPTNNTTQGSMTLSIDGVAQTPTNFSTSNTLLHLEQYGEAARRLDIRATIGNATLILSTSNWDFQNPPTNGMLIKTYDTNTESGTGPNQTCRVNNSITYCDGGLVTYMTNGRNFVSQNIDNEPTGAIVIAQNNTVDKTISGTFDFKVKDFLQPNAQPVHMTGTFTDLPYRVLP